MASVDQFEEEFGARIQKIGCILPFLNPWFSPMYTKILWCLPTLFPPPLYEIFIPTLFPPPLYEIFNSVSLSDSCFELYTAAQAHFIIRVIFAPNGREELLQMYRTGGARQVVAAFAQVTTSTAEASQASDANAITEIIEQLPHGFDTLDRLVRDKLSALVLETLADGESPSDQLNQVQDENAGLQIQVAGGHRIAQHYYSAAE